MSMYPIKNKKGRWWYSNITVLFLLIISLFVWRGVWGVYQKESISSETVKALKEEEESLTKRKEELEMKVESLQTDKGIAREVREKFDVVKEGEYVAILIDPKATTTEVVEEEKGFFEKMWGSLTDMF